MPDSVEGGADDTNTGSPHDPAGSPLRAIVITAATARSILICLPAGEAGAAIADVLEQELIAPTFAGLEDQDLAVLIAQVELEMQMRGWRPQRQWHRLPATPAPPEADG